MTLRVFFRDTTLADEIGFPHQDYAGYDLAARNLFARPGRALSGEFRWKKIA